MLGEATHLSKLTHTVNDTPVPTSTLVDLFFEAVERHRGRIAFQRMSSSDFSRYLAIRPFL